MRGGKLGGCLIALVIAVLLLPSHGWAIFGCQLPCLSDDPGNFRGMYWGHHLSVAPDMKLVGSGRNDFGEVYYVRSADALTFGDAKLAYVQYGFWRDIYSSVTFGTDGVRNWRALKGACFDNFQPWHQPDYRVETYYWVGRHSAMTLQYDGATRIGTLYIYSKAIYERQLAWARSAGLATESRSFWQRPVPEALRY